MGALRDRMEGDLRLRGLSLKTQTRYLGCVSRFAAHFRKSPAEMGYMRKAAEYARAGLAAARATAKSGVSEIALAAEIEGAMRRAGSDYWAITTELASGPRTPGATMNSSSECRRWWASSR